MASQASLTTNRKTAWELDSINTDEKTPLLANAQSAEAPASSKGSPQTTTLTTIPSKSYLKYSDDEEESALLLSEEATAGYFDALVASHEAAYNNLFAHITAHSNGEKFLAKIVQPLFKKMFIEFFSKNPGFNPNQAVQVTQSGKYNPTKLYASNKLAVGNFKYKVSSYRDGLVFEGTFDAAGKWTSSDVSEVIIAAQQVIENAKALVETLRGKYHYRFLI